MTDKIKRSVKVCISLTPEINKKVTAKQATVMKAKGEKYSYSRAVSDILEEHFTK